MFENPDLLVRLFTHQTELGYKVGTFYIACVTTYVALTGFTAQQYFNALSTSQIAATRIAIFGLSMAVMSLAAPFGLSAAMRHIERIAKTYSDALSLPAEDFPVIRFGRWLSLAAFVAITAGWTYVLIRFAV